jgi:DNA-binding transcriptional LysR family regulator
VELREIETFIAVAEELHFARAAERLHVTPSRVSQLVRLMERRVGGPLFLRTSRTVALTPVGARLLADLRPSYDGLWSALRTARRTARGSVPATARLAVAATVAEGSYGPLVDAFQHDHPAYEIGVLTPTFRQHVSVVAGSLPLGEVADAFVAWFPTRESETLPAGSVLGAELARAPRAVLMPEGHPLAARERVDIEEVADHTTYFPAWIESESAQAFMRQWSPPVTPGGRPLRRSAHGIEYVDDLRDVLVENGLLHLTVGNVERMNLPGLVLLPLTGLPPARLLLMLRADAPPAARAFAAWAAARPAAVVG